MIRITNIIGHSYSIIFIILGEWPKNASDLDFNCYGDIQYFYNKELIKDNSKRDFKLPINTRYYNPKTDKRGFKDFLDYRYEFNSDSVYGFLNSFLGEYAYRHAKYFDRVSGSDAIDSLEFYLQQLTYTILDNTLLKLLDYNYILEIIDDSINGRYEGDYGEYYLITIKHIQNPYYIESTPFEYRKSFRGSINESRSKPVIDYQVTQIESELKDWDFNIKLTQEALAKVTDINYRSLRRRLKENDLLNSLFKEVKSHQ